MAAPQEVIFFDPQVAMHNVIKITFFPSRLHVASNYEENVGVCGGGLTCSCNFRTTDVNWRRFIATIESMYLDCIFKSIVC